MRIPLVPVLAVIVVAACVACVDEGAAPGNDTELTGAAASTASATSEPEATPAATPEPTATTPDPTPTPTPTATPTPSPTPTPSATPTPTSTPLPTATPTPLGVSAAEVLEASAAAMNALAAFHFDMDIVVSLESEDSALDIPIEVSGDFQAPDRLRASFVMNLLLLEIKTEIVSMGDTEYVKDPTTGEWEVGVGGGGLFTNPGRLVELETGNLQDLALVGLEVLEGTDVYHLTGGVADGSLGFGGDLQLSLWVRTDNWLLARVRAAGDVALDEAGGDLLGDLDLGTSRAVMVLTLSQFDKEVDIVAPIADAGPTAIATATATATPTPAPTEEPEPQAAPVDDPGAIIQRVAAAMEAAGSVHFEGTISVAAEERSETPLMSMQIEGENAANDDSSLLLTVALDLGGFAATVTFETRQVEGVTYTRDSLTNQWQIEDGDASALGGDIAGPEAIAEFSAEGATVERDVLDGLEVWRITDTAPADPELDRLVMWVGAQDFLVRRLEVEARAPVGELEGLVPASTGEVFIASELTFSAYGHPVVIERP